MQKSRMENATRNVIWGLLYKFTSLLLPFIVRTIMIRTLGSEYLGLSSLFTSVLNILSLAELGFGTAMVYAMYKPVAEDDTETVCALLNLYKKIYRIIGSVILIVGLIILPFIDRFISGDVPSDINIYVLFGMYLFNTVISYWLFAYRSSVLTACQRHDVPVKVNMATNIAKSVSQIIILLLVSNYYLYVIALPVTTIAANLITAYFSKKYYPQYSCRGQINKDLQKQITSKTLALLAVKITGVIYNSVDSVVISAFLGLVMLAKYNNYYYIMSAIIAIITVIYNSLTASVGNSIVVESEEKNYKDFMNLTFINAWLVGWCTVCLLCLYQPFIKIWVGEDLMFDFSVVICFCIYFYVYQLKSVQSAYKDAAGLWREDMWRSYAANIFNLVINIILVRYIGVYGILISTILALLVITYPWQTVMIFNKLFHRNVWPYFGKLGIYTITTLVACLVTKFFCNMITIEGFVGLFINAAICIIVPNLIFLACFFKTKDFRLMIATIKHILKR